MSIENKIKKAVPEITSKFPSIEVMYLFGSSVSGKFREDSDVDIAIFTDETETSTMDLGTGCFSSTTG